MQKKLITFLFFANILDAIATDTGLRHEVITEANTLIAIIYDTNILLYYLIKVGGVSLGLFLLTGLSKKIERSKLVNTLLILTTAVYGGILLLHSVWITLWLS